MRGPICFRCCQWRGGKEMEGGVGFLLWGGEGGTTKIVLFTSNVWLHLIELQSRCCNSDWPLIDLSSDGERQHDWQPDKDLRRELSNACHVIFPETPEVRFLVLESEQQSWFYRPAICIMVNWTFSTSVRTSKGGKCHIWILKGVCNSYEMTKCLNA